MRQRVSTRTLVVAGLAVCLLLAAVVSAWASGHPDGLEHVAETLGFADSAGDHAASNRQTARPVSYTHLTLPTTPYV